MDIKISGNIIDVSLSERNLRRLLRELEDGGNLPQVRRTEGEYLLTVWPETDEKHYARRDV